ncbi:MAG TPA: hypothetical protein PKD59_01790 [Miltoncostaeaceae bacterium]|nr:hypothetical protein [Miltoncostaeaceae bacterium]
MAHWLGMLHRSLDATADAFRRVAEAHGGEPDVEDTCRYLAVLADRQAAELRPFVDRYGEEAGDEPDRLHSELFTGTREGPIALLRDLHDLFLMASECDIAWTLIGQAAQGLRDAALAATVSACEGDTHRQIAWLRTRMKQAAPQVLVVVR